MAKSDASHLSPSASEREPKRQKSCHENDHDEAGNHDDLKDGINASSKEDTALTTSIPNLAPEIWAQICDFLPYHSVLQTAAVSATMLHEVMPRITMLHMEHSYQLHSAVSHRYRDVQDIYFHSLIEIDEGNIYYDRIGCILDEETASRAVPFLCNFMTSSRRLERVFLGGRRPSNGRVEGFIPRWFDDDDDDDAPAGKMKTLIDAFSSAFRSGSLSNKLWIAGLRCPNSSSDDEEDLDCPTCRNACKSFPLESVIDFENEGRVEHNRMDTHYVGMNRLLTDNLRRTGLGRVLRKHAFLNPLYDNNIFGLDVCLPRDEIEEIVKGRPGGKEMLLSDARFMTLLGRGLRRVIVTDDDEELFVVKFDDNQLEEIRQCIKKSSLIVAKLRQNEVVEAITRSFAGDERDTELPPKEQCYLAESSFNALKFLGLPIQESDFVNENGWGSGNKDDFQFRWRFS